MRRFGPDGRGQCYIAMGCWVWTVRAVADPACPSVEGRGRGQICERPPSSFDVLLPPRVDLLVLDDAPLELAGRVAVGGRLLFEDDQIARVRWEAMTRKIYFDELPRITRAHQEFAATATARGR